MAETIAEEPHIVHDESRGDCDADSLTTDSISEDLLDQAEYGDRDVDDGDSAAARIREGLTVLDNLLPRMGSLEIDNDEEPAASSTDFVPALQPTEDISLSRKTLCNEDKAPSNTTVSADGDQPDAAATQEPEEVLTGEALNVVNFMAAEDDLIQFVDDINVQAMPKRDNSRIKRQSAPKPAAVVVSSDEKKRHTMPTNTLPAIKSEGNILSSTAPDQAGKSGSQDQLVDLREVLESDSVSELQADSSELSITNSTGPRKPKGSFNDISSRLSGFLKVRGSSSSRRQDSDGSIVANGRRSPSRKKSGDHDTSMMSLASTVSTATNKQRRLRRSSSADRISKEGGARGSNISLDALDMQQSEHQKMMALPVCQRPLNFVQLPKTETDDNCASRNTPSIKLLGETKEQKQDEKIGGDIDTLICKAISATQFNTEYFDAFLMTFRHFMTPEALITKMLERVQNPCPHVETVEDTIREVTKLRLVTLLAKWVERSWFDFHRNQTMLTLMRAFLLEISRRDMGVFVTRIIKAAKAKEEALDADIKRMGEPGIQMRTTIPQLHAPSQVIIKATADQIAEQLTLIESHFFNKIRSEEFIVFLFMAKKGDNTVLAAHADLRVYIDWFNKLSYWVASEILMAKEKDVRVQIIEKFVRAAKRCYQLRNFNTMYAVLSGLNHWSVARLKSSWKAVGKRYTARLRDLEGKMDPQGNFANYRAIVSDIPMPVVPFIGLLVKDITFINEVPRELAPGIYNWYKMELLYKQIMRIGVYQNSCSYDFTQDDVVYGYLLTTRAYTDKVLGNLSEVCEPRGK
eukprot:Clim_evm73s225 gene=Clim_evmTU73s225